MSAVFTPTRYKWSVEDYHKLGETGILGEDSRVELIKGDLIETAPIGPAHMRCLNRLTRMFFIAAGDLAIVSVQNPVTLPLRSEPQPDITLLKPGFDSAKPPRTPLPQDVLLLVEVADTTLAYDRRTELPLKKGDAPLFRPSLNRPVKKGGEKGEKGVRPLFPR